MYLIKPPAKGWCVAELVSTSVVFVSSAEKLIFEI
jgi:hypothetical protein